MNQEKQRIAIALLTLDISPLWRNILASPESPQKSRQVERFLFQVPDYPNDLNAIHEAKKILSADQKRIYCRIAGDYCKIPYDTFNLSAAQQCEILLKTLNLWEEQ